MPSKRIAAALLGAAILILPRGLHAQESDRHWLEECDDFHRGDRETFCEIRNLDVPSTGSIDIESDNGVVDIAGADQAAPRLRARIRAWGESVEDARARARAVRVTVEGGRLRASGPDTGRGEGWNVDFVGTVPRGYSVAIDVENGPVSVRDVTGAVRIETRNGPLDLRGLGGQVHARGSNGPITLDVSERQVGGIDVETSNGPLTVLLPRGVNARLDAGTDNGPISSNLDLPVRRDNRWSVSGEIEGTLGQGGGEIRARTTNGPLTIRVDD